MPLQLLDMAVVLVLLDGIKFVEQDVTRGTAAVL